jgi:hypothetical protein
VPERLTVVLCVEAGELEAMTVRAVESLRRFGGRFSAAPVLALTPRRGAPLSGWTRAKFRELGVEHVRVRSQRGFSWYHYLNKPVALSKAEEIAGTELIAFLDSDTIVLQEPSELDLPDDVDFAAAVSDIELGGTTGPGHPNEEAWRRICGLVGVDPDDLPWVDAPLDHVRMRLYFNSGVFAYRRSRRVGTQQLELLTRVFRERIHLPGSASRMIEQVVLAPMVVAQGIPWRALSFNHNSTMIGALEYRPEHLREARVLHYHDSMAPEGWDEFLARIEAERPEAAAWLRAAGPIESPASRTAGAIAESFRVTRGVRRRIHGLTTRLAREPAGG